MGSEIYVVHLQFPLCDIIPLQNKATNTFNGLQYCWEASYM